MSSSGVLATGNARRAQSSVIGVVMVIAVTILGVTGVLVFGSSAILDAQGQSELEAAEHAMTQLDSRFSLSALGSSDRQSAVVDLEGDATMRVEGDKGWMNVSVINRTSGEVNDTILNTTLGAISYEQDGTSIAYQGGGVWKRTPDGRSVMVSPPEFHYRTRSGNDPTLTLPLVVVRGNDTIAGEAGVEKHETIPKFPNETDSDSTNPLRNGKINITVDSEYYEAWGGFFKDRTGGSVSYDHDQEQVTVTLVVEQSGQSVSGGVVSGANGGLRMSNKAMADSYNSTQGDHSSNSGENNTIATSGDFTLKNGGKLSGNIEVGGTATVENNAEVTGNVSYGGSKNIKGTVGGDVTNDADVDVPSAVDWLIDERREALDDPGENDNGDTSNISSNELQGCTPCTLPGGKSYYLNEIDLGSSDEVELDTSSGDIEIVVDGDAHFNNGKVEVTGGNKAKFYIEGDGSIKEDGNLTVPGDRAPGLWLYMNPGASFTLDRSGNDGARFVGVVYGPGGGAQDGVDITIEQYVEIYGGLVGVIDEIEKDVDLHFDEALNNEDPLEGHSNGRPTVTYMHVTVNEVNVSAR